MRRGIQRPHAPPRQSRHVGARPPTSSVRCRRPRLWRGGIVHTGVPWEGRQAAPRTSCHRMWGSAHSCLAGSCAGRRRCRGGPTVLLLATRNGSPSERGRPPPPGGRCPAPAAAGPGSSAALARIALALARNSGLRVSELGPAMRGLLRRGWSEEPAAVPPRLRERGRGWRDRAVAAKEAVMTITHPLRDIASGGVVDLSSSILSPGRRASQAWCRSCPSSMFAGHRQEPRRPRARGRHGCPSPGLRTSRAGGRIGKGSLGPVQKLGAQDRGLQGEAMCRVQRVEAGE